MYLRPIISPDAGRMILPGQQAAIPVLLNSQICRSAQPIRGTLSSTHQSFGVRKLANGLHATAASGGPLGMICVIVVPPIGAPIAWQQSTPFLHSDTPMMGFNAEVRVATARMTTELRNILFKLGSVFFRCVFDFSSYDGAFLFSTYMDPDGMALRTARIQPQMNDI